MKLKKGSKMKNNRFEIFSVFIVKLVKTVQTIKMKKMAEYDLKGTNAVCLCRIYESEGGLTASELSAQCGTDKAQVSRCMAELIAKGFVFRDDREGRRYKQKYRLTELGEKAAFDVSSCMKHIEDTVNKNIPAEQLDVFYQTLETLCENLEELKGDEA